MVKRAMFISVVVPVYNGGRYIQDALKSIVQQNFTPIEIIVVDDGSTDDTREKVKAFGHCVQYVHQENQGPAAARNNGIQKAQGQIVAFLDADDVWPQGRLHYLVERMQADPNAAIVLGHIEVHAFSDEVKVPENLANPHIMPLFSCGLFRKSVFDTVGLLDPALRLSEDQDWFLRAKEREVPITIMREVTLIKRMHDKNVTKDAGWKEVDILKVLKRSLDRRRSSNNGDVTELPKLSDFSERKDEQDD